MDDPSKAIVAVVFFSTAAYTIKSIALALIANRKQDATVERDNSASLSEARLVRIEHAVEAIALEVERISEGQRFTTKLLSEQSRLAPKPIQRQLSTNTPT
jgi:hypothetical protein